MAIDWIVFVASLSLTSALGLYFPDIFFGILTLLYLTFFIIIVRTDWTDKQKRFAFAPLVIFPLLWVLMSPLGLSYYGMKRVNSNVVGGWSRMMLSGGANIIRKDGLELLTSPNEYPEYSEYSEIPLSIRKLGYWVKIEQDKKILLVGVGRMFNMADEFGYIIYDASKLLPVPHYLEDSQYYRIWKLADSVYFFEQ